MFLYHFQGSGSKGGSSAIKPSISMVTTKTGNNQTVTLVQKASNAVSAAPPQKLVSVNRPLIKVTPGSAGKKLIYLIYMCSYFKYFWLLLRHRNSISYSCEGK